MASKISFIIQLKDKFGPVAQKINRQFEKVDQASKKAGRSMVAFARKTKKAFAKAAQSAQKFSDKFSGSLKAAAVATAGIVANSIRLFDKQAVAIAKVESGIKSTGKAAGLSSAELQKAASALQAVSTFGDEDILDKATSSLLTFTGIAGENFLRTQELVVDLSAKMGQDLRSSAVQVGKALNDPVANLGALGRVGIQFNDTQTEMIKGFAESGQLSKAQAIILDELQRQFGGTAKAMAEVGAGPLKQLSNSFGDFNEELGKEFLAILKPAINGLKRLVTFFLELSPGTKRVTANVILFGGVLAGLIATVGALAVAFSFLAVPIAAIGAPVLLVGAAILGLGAIAAAVALNWGAITSALGVMWETVSTRVGAAVSVMGVMFKLLLEDLKPGFIAFVNFAIDVINSLLAPLNFVAEKLGFDGVSIPEIKISETLTTNAITAPTAPVGAANGTLNGQITVAAEGGTTVKQASLQTAGQGLNIGMNVPAGAN